MFKSLLLFGVISSLIAAGQTAGDQTGSTAAGSGASSTQSATPPGASNDGLTINSGFATTAPSAQYGGVPAPLLAPPNAALPGSGPATGAPVQIGVNDSRTGGTGNVFQPGASTVTISNNGAAATTNPSASTTNRTNNVLNTGLGRVDTTESSAMPSSTSASKVSQMTVADVARQYKARRASAHPKEFDNSRIDALSNNNARNNTNVTPQTLPQSDNATTSDPPPQAALNPRDLAIVEAELARSRAASAASDSSNTIASNSDNGVVTAQDAANAPAQPATNATGSSANAQATAQATAPTTPQVRQSRSASGNTQKNAQGQQQLPATASSLPLLAFMGLFAAGVGAIFAFRTRKA